jgi:hypothetical protein
MKRRAAKSGNAAAPKIDAHGPGISLREILADLIAEAPIATRSLRRQFAAIFDFV